jgi:Leucine-rich repeat (LRR) protein
VFVDCSNLGLTDLEPPRLVAELAPTGSPTSAPTPTATDDAVARQTFPEADVFYANGNSITHIRAGTFGNQPKLKYLYLHNNPNLVEIEPGAFNNMTNLRELLLHYTALKALPAGIFDNLPNLKILWVHNNARHRGQLEYMEPGVFSQLDSLNWLRLENNNLSSSSLDYEKAKLWPDSLEKLDLSGNERTRFKLTSNDLSDEHKRACCSFCGLSKAADVKADNNLPMQRSCKTLGNKKCGDDQDVGEVPEVQTLVCGCRDKKPIDCGDHCSAFGEESEECREWELAVGGSATTRANTLATLALSVCALAFALW